MKVVLAEKPSVARDIAAELRATQRRDGYLEGGNWVVTWAIGHLVELKEPDEYDASLKRWSVESLPIIPSPFQLRPRGDEGAQKQLGIIKELFEKAELIICATDAGREGELIFRYIQEWSECAQKPFKRLWISSLTSQSIQDGFRNLADGHAYDNLYRAAKCRSEADWIVGLNATRFFTVQYGGRGTLWSLGRVQTPVLAMIVGRDLEIEKFKPEDYWEVHTLYRKGRFKHSKGRFTKLESAEAVIEKIKDHDLVITGLNEKEEKIPPPQLYDLTALQKDMNARFGLTADQTLKVAQGLYESKHLTYPRTDSRHLTADMTPKLAPLLDTLKAIRQADIDKLDLQKLPITKRIVDDKKVSDHHAIIPTEVVAQSLGGDEAKVYDAVVTRFIAVFYPPCVKWATTVHAEANQEKFKASGKVLRDAGWQALYPKSEAAKKKAEEEQELPKFEKGEQGPHAPELKTLKTKPPRPFTEASLLQMMETAGKAVEEGELKEALKNKGIGTPATRAAIIETLIHRKYIERKKKNLLSTGAGRHLVALVRNERLKSPELTGEWEARLKEIEQGKFEPEKFMQDVIGYTASILEQGTGEGQGIGACPKCGGAVIKGRKDYGCSKFAEGCTWVLGQAGLGVQLEPGQVAELLHCGESLKPLMREHAGEKEFGTLAIKDGTLQFNKSAAAAAATPGKDALGACPLCKGAITESPKSFSCANWQNGCPFTVWKVMAKRKIPKAEVKKLLQDGKSGVIDGFKSKAGKPFKARLVVKGDKVAFEF